jgi:hypothetical protein
MLHNTEWHFHHFKRENVGDLDETTPRNNPPEAQSPDVSGPGTEATAAGAMGSSSGACQCRSWPFMSRGRTNRITATTPLRLAVFPGVMASGAIGDGVGELQWRVPGRADAQVPKRLKGRCIMIAALVFVLGVAFIFAAGMCDGRNAH